MLWGTSIIKSEKDEAAKDRSEVGEKSEIRAKGKLFAKNKVINGSVKYCLEVL